MKSLLVFLLCLVAVMCTKWESDNKILKLTEENFHKTIYNNPEMVVEFYFSSKQQSETLSLEYVKAMEILKKKSSSIVFAKVDVAVEKQLGSEYKIERFDPTLKFFKGLNIFDFEDEPSAERIVSWLEREYESSITDLGSVEEAERFIDSQSIVVVGFFQDPKSSAAEIFLKVSKADKDILFAITSTSSVFKNYQVSKISTIVLFERFYSSRNELDSNFTETSIKEFIDFHKIPIVVPERNIRVNSYNNLKMHFVTFLPNHKSEFVIIDHNIRELSRTYRGKILFVYVKYDRRSYGAAKHFYGVTEKDIPCFRFSVDKNANSKFKPKNESILFENMHQFVQDVINGKIKPYLKSQEIPRDWNQHPVKVLVGINFDTVVKDRTQNVFVVIYSSETDSSSTTDFKFPILEEAANFFKYREDILVAKMEISKNEIRGIEIDTLPALLYSPKNTNDIAKYNGPITLEAIKTILGKDDEDNRKQSNAMEEEDKQYEKKVKKYSINPKQLIDKNDFVIVGFFKDLRSTGAKAFISVSETNHYIIFTLTSKKEDFSYYNIKSDSSMVLFRKMDKSRKTFSGHFTEQAIRDFIETYQWPILVEFDAEKNVQLDQCEINIQVVIFLETESDRYFRQKMIVQRAAKRFRGKVIFIVLDAIQYKADKETFDPAKVPFFRIIISKPTFLTYRPENEDFNVENIERFVQSVIENKTKPYFKSDEIPENWNEKPVKILVGKNFDSVARDKLKSVFVEFHDTRCQHCEAFIPVWNSLAEAYQHQPDVVVARIHKNNNEVPNLEINGPQMLKLFPKNSDEVISYNGELTLEYLKRFVDSDGKDNEAANPTNPPGVVSLSSISEAENLIKSDDAVVIGFFVDPVSEEANVFRDVASSHLQVPFGITSNLDVFNRYRVTQNKSIAMFKSFDDSRNDFDETFTKSALTNFIERHWLPVVVELSPTNQFKVFSGSIRTFLLVFMSRETDQFDTMKSNMTEPARKFLDTVKFVVVNRDDKNNDQMLEICDIGPSKTPRMRILEITEGGTPIYEPEIEDITRKNMERFVQDVLDKKIPIRQKSEDIPEDWDKNTVKILVGKNFDLVARDKSKSVFVLFYDTNSKLGSKLYPIWNSLGEMYKDNQEIVVAKINAVKNKFTDINIEKFPTLMFFSKNSNDMIEYNGEHNVEAFKLFLDTDGKSDNYKSVVDLEYKEEVMDSHEEHRQRDEL